MVASPGLERILEEAEPNDDVMFDPGLPHMGSPAAEDLMDLDHFNILERQDEEQWAPGADVSCFTALWDNI